MNIKKAQLEVRKTIMCIHVELLLLLLLLLLLQCSS